MTIAMPVRGRRHHGGGKGRLADVGGPGRLGTRTGAGMRLMANGGPTSGLGRRAVPGGAGAGDFRRPASVGHGCGAASKTPGRSSYGSATRPADGRAATSAIDASRAPLTNRLAKAADDSRGIRT